MTQEELAESAEISLSHLSKVESGSRMIGMKTYSKNFVRVKCSPHYDNGNRKERNTFRFSVASIINIKKNARKWRWNFFLLNTVETIKKTIWIS